jgi:uncharacterized protein YcgI (DUF1989 family)
LSNYPKLPSQHVVIPARASRAFLARKGQVVRIYDEEGAQVADFYCVAAEQPDEHLSGIVTTQLNKDVYPKVGYPLWSSRRRVMFTIIEDTVGRHDLLMGACSPAGYLLRYGVTGHVNCMELLQSALAPLGIRTDAAETFNAFMNVVVGPDGKLNVDVPISKRGDHVDLLAEIDCVVAIASCPADLSPTNGWTPTAIGVEVSARRS